MRVTGRFGTDGKKKPLCPEIVVIYIFYSCYGSDLDFILINFVGKYVVGRDGVEERGLGKTSPFFLQK